jgi:hypothetical protein
VKFFDPFIQEEREVRAGRMECTMQNLADSLTSRSAAALAGTAAGSRAEQALMDRLSTFMVYNMRRKVSGHASAAADMYAINLQVQTHQQQGQSLSKRCWTG